MPEIVKGARLTGWRLQPTGDFNLQVPLLPKLPRPRDCLSSDGSALLVWNNL